MAAAQKVASKDPWTGTTPRWHEHEGVRGCARAGRGLAGALALPVVGLHLCVILVVCAASMEQEVSGDCSAFLQFHASQDYTRVARLKKVSLLSSRTCVMTDRLCEAVWFKPTSCLVPVEAVGYGSRGSWSGGSSTAAPVLC